MMKNKLGTLNNIHYISILSSGCRVYACILIAYFLARLDIFPIIVYAWARKSYLLEERKTCFFVRYRGFESYVLFISP